jgi:hypothetical protein
VKDSRSSGQEKSIASSSARPINPIKVGSIGNNQPEAINESLSSASPEVVSSAFKKKPERMANSLANIDASKINGSLKKDAAEPVHNSMNQ